MSAQPSMAWVGDRLVRRDKAAIPLDDFAARYGAACFETMLVRNGRVFRLDAHLDRLAAGLHGMGVEPPAAGVVRDAIEATLAASGLHDASLRLAVSAGSGHRPDLDAARAPLMTLTADPLPSPPPSPHLRVVSVRLDERRPLREAKTANFLPYLLARREARHAGADDALLLNHAGDVAEAATANVFALLDGVLVTPAIESGPLAGITRAALIEVARSLDVLVAERTIVLDDLARAEAVLLTSSIAGLVPVASIEAAPPASPGTLSWRAPSPGSPAAERLRAAYEALVARECGVAARSSEA